MADSIHLDRILERLNNRFLADHILKDLRPELSVNDLIFHESVRAGRRFQDRLRGLPCHIGLPDTVASFRTWRGFQAPIAQPPKACAVKRAPRLNGESGIRTHGGVTPTHAFQACSLNHSDISPEPSDSTTRIQTFISSIYRRRASRSEPAAASCEPICFAGRWSVFCCEYGKTGRDTPRA